MSDDEREALDAITDGVLVALALTIVMWLVFAS